MTPQRTRTDMLISLLTCLEGEEKGMGMGIARSPYS